MRLAGMKGPDMADTATPPKNVQTYRTMLERLKAGLYPVGMRMPTEGELAGGFRGQPGDDPARAGYPGAERLC